MGTPEFALPVLEQLSANYQVVGVVTQPDRPAGRGRKLLPSPVKELALAEGIPIFQPEKLRRMEAVERLRAWLPDLIVVAAYGQILPPSVLELPRYGCINVHASLLPRWRGASPIQAAILAGDAVTGITLMKMDEGLDTGPILAQQPVDIGPEETAGELSARLARVGGQLLLETLPDYLAGRLTPTPQPDSGITIARRFRKQASALDWSKPAADLARRVRAFSPTPGAYTTWNGAHLKVLRARPLAQDTADRPPGSVFLEQRVPAVVTGEGALVLMQVQMAGKRPMSGEQFARGRRDFIGSVLGS